MTTDPKYDQLLLWGVGYIALIVFLWLNYGKDMIRRILTRRMWLTVYEIVLLILLIPILLITSSWTEDFCSNVISILAIIGGITLLVILAIELGKWKKRRSLKLHGWRVEIDNGSDIYYYELIGGSIYEIKMRGEATTKGRCRVHVPTTYEWDRTQPEWVKGRRDEIVGRLKQRLPEPYYEYIDTYPDRTHLSGAAILGQVEQNHIRVDNDTLIWRTIQSLLVLLVGVFLFWKGLEGETVIPWRRTPFETVCCGILCIIGGIQMFRLRKR